MPLFLTHIQTQQLKAIN